MSICSVKLGIEAPQNIQILRNELTIESKGETTVDIKEMTNEELKNLANEMLPRVSALGELVGQTFPDAEPAISECVNVLQSCMTVLTDRANVAAFNYDLDHFDLIENVPTHDACPLEELKKLATKDCIATFKALETIRTNSKDNMGDPAIQTIDVLGTHARELFNTLSKG